MQKLIKNNQIIVDSSEILPKDCKIAINQLPQQAIIPMGFFLANKSELTADGKLFGIWLDSDEDPELIANDVHRFKIIALNFPKFTDGRGYSLASLLRNRYNYKNELRAIGDILQDQLFYLKRCGFDAFAMRKDQDLATAIKGFNDFSTPYQIASDAENSVLLKRKY